MNPNFGALAICILLSQLIKVVTSVKIRVLDIPQVVRSGHSTRLTCDYDLERQRLYMVKWYKGSHEFYRYTPRDKEKKKLFLVENLHVDPNLSDDRNVELRNLHVDMTGKYTCEVSTEAIFETVQKSAEMTVVIVPRGRPHIQGHYRDIKLGDTVNLNCTSLRSKPAAALEFYVNNQSVNKDRNFNLKHSLIVNENERPTTESTLLSMTFKVSPYLVKNGKINVKCVARSYLIYNEERSVELFVKTREAANYNQISLNGSNSSSRCSAGIILASLWIKVVQNLV